MAKDNSNQGPSVRIEQKTYQRSLMKKLGLQVILALILTFLIYMAFAATIMRVVPTTDSGLAPVKDNTETGGVIPMGTEVLIAREGKKVEQTIKANLLNSLTPQSNTARVEVLAGPAGEVTLNKKGEVLVDGESISMVFPDGFTEVGFLKDEYLGTCVGGSCALGEPVLFPEKSVYGLTLSKDDFSHGPNFSKLND